MTVQEIYDGSNGDATRDLYGKLCQLGPKGVVAMNLFRASKCSGRAKVYRGGTVVGGRKRTYKRMAYDRKAWSLQNLCEVLTQHAAALGLTWGWRDDPDTLGYPWVLYVDLPNGQVSFHSPCRGKGPDYPGTWDRERASSIRIVEWTEEVLNEK